MENNVDQSLEESYDALLDKQEEQLENFWNDTREEIEKVKDFKNQQLPLARIKKIMKSDRDVAMISAEAPILFAKACELFITELTIRSWLHAEENKRRTLNKTDVEMAISRDDVFDFLIDVVPIDANNAGNVGGPYYYTPMLLPAVDPSMYLQPPPSHAQTDADADASGQDNLDDQS